MSPADILAVVEDQFFDVRRRLDLQLASTAELQQQLDTQRKEIGEVHKQVDLAHRLLRQLIARTP